MKRHLDDGDGGDGDDDDVLIALNPPSGTPAAAAAAAVAAAAVAKRRSECPADGGGGGDDDDDDVLLSCAATVAPPAGVRPRRSPPPTPPLPSPPGQSPDEDEILASVCFDGGGGHARDDDLGEFSDDDADAADATAGDAMARNGTPPPPPAPPAPLQQPQQQLNPLVALADALGTPVSMLDESQAPHVIAEAAFRHRQARTARVRHDGTLDAPLARLPLAFDEEARRDRATAAATGDARTRLMMARMFDVGGTCPQPPPNGLITEITRVVRYLRHLPANRSVNVPEISAMIERCVVDRETPARWDNLRQLLRWRSGLDDVHYMVQAGYRQSPTNPALTIESRPCVYGDRCEGFLNFPQLAGCPPGSFMPIGYISKEELAHHYATGQWPEGGAGNVPCIFCTWYLPHYLQSAISLERGNQWLPFVVAQCDFNSVGTYHGYRPEHVLRRSGQHDSIVLAPLAKWDSNALSVYFDAAIGKYRVDHGPMLVTRLERGASLATFATDTHPPDATECVPPEVLNVSNTRVTQALHETAVTAPPPRPVAAVGSAAAAAARRPEPFFGHGARPLGVVPPPQLAAALSLSQPRQPQAPPQPPQRSRK